MTNNSERGRTFDPTIKRKFYWIADLSDKEKCPECDASLEAVYQTYVIALKGHQDDDFESIIVNGEDIHFCTAHCPIAIMDEDVVRNVVLGSLGLDNLPPLMQFMPLGTVDIERISDDASLSSDDNPIPLIPFSNFETNPSYFLKYGVRQFVRYDEPFFEIKKTEEELRWRPARKRLAGRNEPCPCGSGKKYKKCCGR